MRACRIFSQDLRSRKKYLVRRSFDDSGWFQRWPTTREQRAGLDAVSDARRANSNNNYFYQRDRYLRMTGPVFLSLFLCRALCCLVVFIVVIADVVCCFVVFVVVFSDICCLESSVFKLSSDVCTCVSRCSNKYAGRTHVSAGQSFRYLSNF